MELRIKSNKLKFSGYVNATGRQSLPMKDTEKDCLYVESISPGAFALALQRNDNVLLKHNHERVISSQGDKSFTLKEDGIGLYIEGEITDEAIIQKAKEGKIRGWSFGFYPEKWQDRFYQDNIDIAYERSIQEMELNEVSIVDDTKVPAYNATSFHVRDKDGKKIEIRFYSADFDVIEEEKEPEKEKKEEKRTSELKLKGKYQTELRKLCIDKYKA